MTSLPRLLHRPPRTCSRLSNYTDETTLDQSTGRSRSFQTAVTPFFLNLDGWLFGGTPAKSISFLATDSSSSSSYFTSDQESISFFDDDNRSLFTVEEESSMHSEFESKIVRSQASSTQSRSDSGSQSYSSQILVSTGDPSNTYQANEQVHDTARETDAKKAAFWKKFNKSRNNMSGNLLKRVALDKALDKYSKATSTVNDSISMATDPVLREEATTASRSSFSSQVTNASRSGSISSENGTTSKESGAAKGGGNSSKDSRTMSEIPKSPLIRGDDDDNFSTEGYEVTIEDSFQESEESPLPAVLFALLPWTKPSRANSSVETSQVCESTTCTTEVSNKIVSGASTQKCKALPKKKSDAQRMTDYRRNQGILRRKRLMAKSTENKVRDDQAPKRSGSGHAGSGILERLPKPRRKTYARNEDKQIELARETRLHVAQKSTKKNSMMGTNSTISGRKSGESSNLSSKKSDGRKSIFRSFVSLKSEQQKDQPSLQQKNLRIEIATIPLRSVSGTCEYQSTVEECSPGQRKGQEENHMMLPSSKSRFPILFRKRRLAKETEKSSEGSLHSQETKSTIPESTGTQSATFDSIDKKDAVNGFNDVLKGYEAITQPQKAPQEKSDGSKPLSEIQDVGPREKPTDNYAKQRNDMMRKIQKIKAERRMEQNATHAKQSATTPNGAEAKNRSSNKKTLWNMSEEKRMLKAMSTVVQRRLKAIEMLEHETLAIEEAGCWGASIFQDFQCGVWDTKAEF
jgi:hypothetical protein